MQHPEAKQQNQSPQKSPPEVDASSFLIPDLDVETEPEQQRENGIGLAPEQKKHDLQQPAVDRVQKGRNPFRSLEYVILFRIVEQDDGAEGKSPQGVDHVDAVGMG